MTEAGAFHAHRPSVKLDDLRHDRETEAQARPLTGCLFRLAIQLEYVRRKLGADAVPGIADRQPRLIGVTIEPDVDLASGRCELDGVAQKVPYDLQQPHAVAVDRRGIEREIQLDLNLASTRTGDGHLECRADHGRPVDFGHLDAQLL